MKSILQILIIVMLFSSCKTTEKNNIEYLDIEVKQLLGTAQYDDAQSKYFQLKNEGSISAEFILKYDQFFNVIALYDFDYEKSPDQIYRYASCVDLTYYGEDVTEWRSIAAQGNPFPLSLDKVEKVKQQLFDFGLWNGPIDDIVSSEFQKAIMYFRLLNGMNVECILYPHDLILKSTFCSLFSDDIRCQKGYEF